jgi:hypothetical protein
MDGKAEIMSIKTLLTPWPNNLTVKKTIGPFNKLLQLSKSNPTVLELILFVYLQQLFSSRLQRA